MAITEKRKVVVYVPHEEADELQQISDAEDRPITGLIRLAITAWLSARRTAPQ